MSDIVQGEVAVISNEKAEEKEQLKKYIKELLPSSVKLDTVALETTATAALEHPNYQSLSDSYLLESYKANLNEAKPNLTLSEKFAKAASSVGSSFKNAASSVASRAANIGRDVVKVARYGATTGFVAGGKSRRRAKKSSRAKKANRSTRRK